MKINVPLEELIFIELNKKDMERLGLSFEGIDYSDEETRKILFSVLSRAKSSLGRDFNLSDTRKIEMLPRENGGCLLFFTIAGKRRGFLLNKDRCRIILEFPSPDSFLDMKLTEISLSCEGVRSSLYLSGGKYYLLLTGNVRSSLLMKLSEYAAVIKSEEAPEPDKNNILAGENALEILCGGVSE